MICIDPIDNHSQTLPTIRPLMPVSVRTNVLDAAASNLLGLGVLVLVVLILSLQLGVPTT